MLKSEAGIIVCICAGLRVKKPNKGELMLLRKAVGSLLLLAGVTASAENFFQDEWDAKGLIGLELGGGVVNVKQVMSNDIVVSDDTEGMGSFGLKFGGESENYRAFLEARFIGEADYDYIGTVGASIQYLIRTGETFNIFMGINGGQLYSRATENDIEYTNSDPYLGVDAGVNFDFTENLGLELGARFQKVLTSNDDPFMVDYIAQGYAGIIFKFTGDY
jgi:hypothetical protein